LLTTLLLAFYFSIISLFLDFVFFFFQAEDGIRDLYVTGVQTCALPISRVFARRLRRRLQGRRNVALRLARPRRRRDGHARRHSRDGASRAPRSCRVVR